MNRKLEQEEKTISYSVPSKHFRFKVSNFFSFSRFEVQTGILILFLSFFSFVYFKRKKKMSVPTTYASERNRNKIVYFIDPDR